LQTDEANEEEQKEAKQDVATQAHVFERLLPELQEGNETKERMAGTS
jgi:hypothetical protein